MEPVFMVLGQSAATAAAMAIDGNLNVQDVSYDRLRERLLKDGQVLDYDRPPSRPSLDPKKLPGIVLDDVDARRLDAWLESSSIGGFVGQSYLHDNNEGKGARAVRYELSIPQAGRYEVRVSYTTNPNRATNTPITIETVEGAVTKHVNQRQAPPIDGAWTSLGVFPLKAGKAIIVISNRDTDGHVIADAVQLLPAQ
jgi:hypothetical protein